MQQSNAAYLIIQLGNRWTDVLRLQPEQAVLVGRSSECQIVVKDEKVSRKHSRISPMGGGWVVNDLGSRNGTQVENATIAGEHPLVEGETIAVGSCLMTFTYNLARGFGLRPNTPDNQAASGDQQTELIQPTILNRLSNSQWSEAIEPSTLGTETPGTGTQGGHLTSRGNHRALAGNQLQRSDHWNFFYRLVFELVSCSSRETACQVALDRLLDSLQLSSGGVVTIESEVLPDAQPSLAVLATRQPQGGSYHRVSDFLVKSVVNERQAVLARNVQDDSKLSVARNSGQREVISIICAPLRNRQTDGESVMGLLHVYSSGEERMLTEADLELVVGVADNLAIALSRQLEKEELSRSLANSRRRADLLEKQLDISTSMVGDSKALARVRQAIERAGPTQATVLIRGESGVGKELVARAIHSNSHRRDGPLVCINCAALAPTLLESELFGHEKGAFTGATERKIGKFEAADGGTLLLDEIGEMSHELQAKFLRVLEGQSFERLGGNKAIKTEVRVIAATNRALEEAVQAKQFRADLYYRIRVIEIEVPALRQRLEDVPQLVEHFINQLRHHAGRRLAGIAPAALELLMRHSWPGNVRELRNVIERAIVLGSGATIEPSDLNLSSLGAKSPTAAEQTTGGFQPIALAELEKQHIFAMLEFAGGNKTKASQLLGIERSTLDRKLKKFD